MDGRRDRGPGLHISELALLRRSDIDLATGLIRLKDERAQGHQAGSREIRTTKRGRGRTLPIHDQLREVIERLPVHADGHLLHGPGVASSRPTRSALC